MAASLGLPWSSTVWAQPDGPPSQPPENPEQPAEAPESERAAPPPSEAEPAPTVDPITPPVVLEQVQATAPEGVLQPGEQRSVTLRVTVGADGAVEAVEAIEAIEPELEVAAIDAVRQWRFAPARRGRQPIAARIRVDIQFEAPPETEPSEPDPAPDEPVGPSPAPEPDPEAEPGPDAEPAPEQEPIDVTVRGKRPLRATDRSASHFEIERDVLEAAPRQEGADVLDTAPGVFIARGEGMAVAHRYMLRGFDADHGQDIEIKVGGLPINLPSHIHGQGYADLGFLIGEAVQRLEVTEGVYDPRQGDFAVAGTFDIHLGMPERGVRLASSYGRFNTFRQLAAWAPEGQDEQTFGAVQYSRTDGFGQNRRGQSGSGIVQTEFSGDGPWDHRMVAFLHGARSQLAGVVRIDDVRDGTVGYHGVYPFPTARAQSALAGRIMAGWFSEYRGQRGDNAEVGVWLGFDDFRLQENFTGFMQRSRVLENVAGRGDLIEQRNRTFSMGLSGWYRTKPYRPADWARGSLELGLSGRLDSIEQSQNLLDATVRNQTWDRRVDAVILGADLGMWGDLDWWFTQYLRVRLGMRVDVLYYDVEDRLGNFVPSSRPDDAFIQGFRRSAFGIAWGPRTSAEVLPLDWLSLRAAYGEGYRSPQARVLEDGERAPFTKVRSGDLGVRVGKSPLFEISAAGYYTHLSDDVAFHAEEGRLERIGATRRLGATLHAQTRPLPWLLAAASVTYVDAELLEPPPATAEEPQPPFQAGQNLPFVPPVVVRVDAGAQGPLARRGRPWEVTGRIGLGFSYLSPRPLPFGAFSDHVPLLDASAGLGVGPIDLGVSLFNLANRRYAAVEYNFVSDWDPDAPRSRVPSRHIAAGSPFSFMVTLGVSL